MEATNPNASSTQPAPSQHPKAWDVACIARVLPPHRDRAWIAAHAPHTPAAPSSTQQQPSTHRHRILATIHATMFATIHATIPATILMNIPTTHRRTQVQPPTINLNLSLHIRENQVWTYILCFGYANRTTIFGTWCLCIFHFELSHK